MNELKDFEYLKLQYDKDLHEVFGTVLDTFPDITGATVQGQIYLWELLQKIKCNFLQDIDVNTFLLNKYVNGRRSAEYDNKKEQLPAICYNARFNGYKDLKHLKSITNLMFLDIDDLGSKEEAIDYKKHIIEKYNWILACNLSLSKLGLHVIIMVDKIIDNKDYNYKYDYISKEYFNGKLDKDSKSLTRYTVVPCDFNIYINECPNILDIEHIIRNDKKGIRSGYTKDKKKSSSSNNEKGICSGYIKEKGISCDEKKKIISTAYTFSPFSQVKELMNVAGRKYYLKFRQDVDESLFTDPNVPLYVHEGIDVISINLYPYRYTGVKDGHRTDFIGVISAQMIYLNASPDNTDPKIREDILKFILSINKKICDPPLSYKEVLNSYNANWKSYDAGELDVSKYFRKQKAFWSRNATIRGNEKRKVTCKIKNEPTVAKSRKKISDAIEDIQFYGKKITQKKVAKVSGLGLPTIKKYWKEFKEMVRQSNFIIKNKSDVISEAKIKYKNQDFKSDPTSIEDTQEPNPIINNGNIAISETGSIMAIDDIENANSGMNVALMDSEIKFELSDEQIHLIYDRIFHSLKSKLDKHQEELLFTKFVNLLDAMLQNDLKLLSINIDDINDSSTFWKQSALEGKFWDLCDDLIPARGNMNVVL
jgi:hypothetical protein